MDMNFSGFHRQPRDSRDRIFSATSATLAALPRKMNLVKHEATGQLLSGPFSNPWNQGSLGSCGPHTLAELLMYDQMAAGVEQPVKPSPLFIYWCVRRAMGTLNQDSGVNNRALVKTIADTGWTPENLHPYDIDRFREQPSAESFVAARNNRITEYRAIPQTQEQIKACIAGGPDVQGRPFILGFMVFESFTSEQVQRTGRVPTPGRSDVQVGGHDVLGIGYDDNGVIFLNHYSGNWGNGGYGFLEWDYILNPDLAGDYWTTQWATPGQARNYDLAV